MLPNIYLFVFILPLLLALRYKVIQPIQAYRVQTIYIDQGHGGRDSGCVSCGIKESKLAYQISKKLGEKIKAYYANQVKVVYSRKGDEFMGLDKRIKKVRRTKPDLLLSIHCNSCKIDKRVRGLEVYVMGPKAKWPSLGIIADLKDRNERVIARENNVITLEKNWQKKYANLDSRATHTAIIFKNFAFSAHNNSLFFAKKIEESFINNNIPSRGVHEGPFILLWRSTCGSILIELGYLTNEKDRLILSTNLGQDMVVESIFNAIKKYKGFIESRIP